MSRTVRLELLGLPDTDDDELLRLVGRLRRSLADLDVAEIGSAPSSENPPTGSKGGELVATGTLIVTAASFALRQALLLADTWLKNRPLRGIRVELDGRSVELGHASAAERERLIDAFLASAGQPDAEPGRPAPEPSSQDSNSA
ncbi:hypothetical protein [Streptomyces sp. NPDC002763]|uniref:hypothetical protein n=1 Tax=Streptomyces sp. NPDC002763 TaxID=3154427 RepID=UPI003333584D